MYYKKLYHLQIIVLYIYTYIKRNIPQREVTSPSNLKEVRALISFMFIITIFKKMLPF